MEWDEGVSVPQFERDAEARWRDPRKVGTFTLIGMEPPAHGKRARGIAGQDPSSWTANTPPTTTSISAMTERHASHDNIICLRPRRDDSTQDPGDTPGPTSKPTPSQVPAQ